MELSDGAQGESLGWGHRSLCTSLASFWNALPSYSCLEKPFSSFETQPEQEASPHPSGLVLVEPQMCPSSSYLAQSLWPGAHRAGLTHISASPSWPDTIFGACWILVDGHCWVDSRGWVFYLKIPPPIIVCGNFY